MPAKTSSAPPSLHFRETTEDEGDDVEVSLEREAPQITLQPIDAHSGALCPSAGSGNGGRAQIHTRHHSTPLRHGNAVPPTATGKVQYAVTGGQQVVLRQESDLSLRVTA